MGHVYEQQRAIYGGRNGPYTRATMRHICAHACPIDTLIYGPCICPLLLLNMAYYCSKTWLITALVQIRYKAWRFTAFLIVLIFVPLNGACMRAYIGHMGAAMGHAYAHTWPYMGAAMGQQWGMHTRIHGHIWGQQWGSNGAAMGHACAHTWPYMGAAMGHACAHI